jgi:hypothetical protein
MAAPCISISSSMRRKNETQARQMESANRDIAALLVLQCVTIHTCSFQSSRHPTSVGVLCHRRDDRKLVHSRLLHMCCWHQVTAK